MLFKFDNFYFLQQVTVAVAVRHTATATSVCILVKYSSPSERLLFETIRSNKHSFLFLIISDYSSFKIIEGFKLAVLKTCKLTVSQANTTITIPLTINIHNSISIR